MKVTLIYPPVADLRAPQLGLPSLAAFLKQQDHLSVKVLDLALESTLALLTPERLIRGCKILMRKNNRNQIEKTRWYRAMFVAESIQNTISFFRDSDQFYEPNNFNIHRHHLQLALNITAAARHASIRFGLHPIEYGIKGCDIRRLDDLIKHTANPDTNVFYNDWKSEVIPKLIKEGTDLVGITITNYQQVIPGLSLARMIKATGIHVVLGGAFFSKFSTEIKCRPEFFKHFADALFVYEGEQALLDYCNALEKGSSLEAVPNLLYCQGDLVVSTPTYLQSLNELPIPDFSDLPLSKYLTPEVVLPLALGKGCFHNQCKFCEIPFINHISRKRYRARSLDVVIRDIKAHKEKYDCRHFVITDEAVPINRLEHFADTLKEAGIDDIHYTAYGMFERGITVDKLRKARQFGLEKLYFGLESGNQEVLDHMQKGITTSDSIRGIEACNQTGVSVHIFSMIGFPDETTEQAKDTLSFFTENKPVLDLPGTTFDIHQFNLDGRSEYFLNAEKYGIIINEEVEDLDFPLTFDRKEWNASTAIPAEQIASILQQYNEVLNNTFNRFHSRNLWPIPEEYSVIFGSHYRDKQFSWVCSIGSIMEEEHFVIEIPDGTLRHRNAAGHLVLQIADHIVTLTPIQVAPIGKGPFSRSTINRFIGVRVGFNPKRVREVINKLEHCVKYGFLVARVCTLEKEKSIQLPDVKVLSNEQ